MPVNFLTTLDGTGRAPTPLQVDVLRWVQAQKARVIAIQAPTGTGKSYIVRTMQRATGGLIIAPSVVLMGQYESIYPELNSLKGMDHYKCTKEGMTCGAVRELEQPACKGCPYKAARAAAIDGEATLFNPISLYALTRDEDFCRPRTTIVDEAHTLVNMLLLVAGDKFSSRYFRLPDTTDQLEILDWLRSQETKVRQLADHFSSQRQGERAMQALRDYTRIQTVIVGLEENPHNYVIYRERDNYTKEDVLHVRPLMPPRALVERVLGQGRIVLLSATLSRLDAELLAPGEEVAYYDAASPIPVAQRPVYYRPMSGVTNSRTDVDHIAKHVADILADNPGNALIHATYAMNTRLCAALNKIGVKAFANSADTKPACIERFKSKGGVFVAAGCAEGLDLPDDQCRVNIIPILPRPSPVEPAVQKWLALPGGRRRYDLETMRTVQQQVGRSTRHVRDRSRTFICDNGFPRVYGAVAEDLPKSFKDAIHWTKGK